MNYKAVEVIWIFLADTRTDRHTDTRTDRGVPRGPRGPKNMNNLINNSHSKFVWDQNIDMKISLPFAECRAGWIGYDGADFSCASSQVGFQCRSCSHGFKEKLAKPLKWEIFSFLERFKGCRSSLFFPCQCQWPALKKAVAYLCGGEGASWCWSVG